MSTSEDDLPLSELARLMEEDSLPLSEMAIPHTPASLGLLSNSDDIPLECLMQLVKPTRVIVRVCDDDMPLNNINKTAVDLRWERLTLLLLKGEELWRQKLRQIAFM